MALFKSPLTKIKTRSPRSGALSLFTYWRHGEVAEKKNTYSFIYFPAGPAWNDEVTFFLKNGQRMKTEIYPLSLLQKKEVLEVFKKCCRLL